MKLTEAYTIYNNGIQSMEPKLAEAIDRIIDAKSKAVDRYKECYEICERGMHRAHDLYKDSQEKLDKVELAEVKARMEAEELAKVALDDTYDGFMAQREIKCLREALEFYADEKRYYSWNDDGASDLDIDKGSTARKALAGDSDAI